MKVLAAQIALGLALLFTCTLFAADRLVRAPTAALDARAAEATSRAAAANAQLLWAEQRSALRALLYAHARSAPIATLGEALLLKRREQGLAEAVKRVLEDSNGKNAALVASDGGVLATVGSDPYSLASVQSARDALEGAAAVRFEKLGQELNITAAVPIVGGAALVVAAPLDNARIASWNLTPRSALHLTDNDLLVASTLTKTVPKLENDRVAIGDVIHVVSETTLKDDGGRSLRLFALAPLSSGMEAVSGAQTCIGAAGGLAVLLVLVLVLITKPEETAPTLETEASPEPKTQTEEQKPITSMKITQDLRRPASPPEDTPEDRPATPERVPSVVSPSHLPDCLGSEAFRVVATITDEALRQRLFDALEVCAAALEQVDAFNISKYELAALSTPDAAVWAEIAPDVHDVLLTMQQTADRITELFSKEDQTKPEDDERVIAAIFDFLEDSEAPKPTRDNRELEIERIVENVDIANRENLEGSISTMVAMLDEDLMTLAKRLRNPKLVEDRWLVLGELHEHENRWQLYLEAIVATILKTWSVGEIVDVFPRYTTSIDRAQQLRTEVVDLGRDVARYHDAFERAPLEDARVLWLGFISRLNEFSRHVAYRYVRPQDKRNIILFRIFLNNWEQEGEDLEALRTQAEEFLNFIEDMRSINRRPGLIEHDADYLEEARTKLESGIDPSEVGPLLEKVYGRSFALDEKIISFRTGQIPKAEEIIPLIIGVQSTFAMR